MRSTKINAPIKTEVITLVLIIGPRSIRANKRAPDTETIKSAINKRSIPSLGRSELNIGWAGK